MALTTWLGSRLNGLSHWLDVEMILVVDMLSERASCEESLCIAPTPQSSGSHYLTGSLLFAHPKTYFLWSSRKEKARN